jgi:MerR family transcriptional regulator, thiopeptide resistance regulator
MMSAKLWKIGELASRTGVTVRTLHHYDDIGLLRPALRTRAGYRQYTEADVVRLQQIVSLRQVGVSLDEIAEYLRHPSSSPLAVIEQHLARLRERIEAAHALYERLERIAGALRVGGMVSATELIETMEMMTMIEKYYTTEQLEQLAARREQVGEERIREVEAEWPRLMEEVRAEMEKGTDPADPRVQELARRWQGLVAEFTGGDPGISASLQKMYDSEEEVHAMQVGPMRELGEYVQRALKAGGSAS